MTEELIESSRNKPVVSPREFIARYIRVIPWVILSVTITLAAAWLKLRYSTPIYTVSGKLLATTQSPYGSSSDKFDNIFMPQANEKINDQIEIIRSRSIATRVVRSLGLQKQIYNRGKIRTSVVHTSDVPFNFDIVSIKDSLHGFSVAVTLLPDRLFLVNEQPTKYFFNQTIEQPGVTFRITANNKDLRAFASNEFIISWRPTESVAAGLSGGISVNRINDFTNMLVLSYHTENTKLGIDIINQYMVAYQEASLEDKREIAAKTIDFIEEQLDTVRYDLGSVERSLQNYQERNRIFNTELQSQVFFEELNESGKQLAQEGLKLQVTDYLIKYLNDKDNKHKIIVPSMLGINEPALLVQVTEFNKLQLERETLSKTIPSGNQRIIDLETAIDRLRTDMVENLQNVRQTNLLTLNELRRKNKDVDRLISSMPSKQKQMLEVTRQQDILQELYSFLLQKKLETAIASASTISNIKVVESAMAAGIQVSPNRKALYIFAIIIGLAIPVGVVFMREFLNDKVKSKYEIQQITEVPILGEIGHAEETGALVVTLNNRKFLAEQFRIVRSNLQYILPKVDKPILLVTSSFSGEGKSFISTNLGSVLALSGKRTVILEFDIRKPKILKGLGLHERKGITNYIVGNVQFQDVIHPVPDVENLYVIPCGPVPPNPSEMLLNEKVELLFKELRKSFDAIIIDTAPVGLVSDAFTLGRHADASVYIVRHNYTHKKQIHLIDDIYVNKKLPHLSIIINDIDIRSSYGGYYGYGTYGYGFGYNGSSEKSSYFENSGRKSKSGWRKWFSRSSK